MFGIVSGLFTEIEERFGPWAGEQPDMEFAS
jgi:hypothetical protein